MHFNPDLLTDFVTDLVTALVTEIRLQTNHLCTTYLRETLQKTLPNLLNGDRVGDFELFTFLCESSSKRDASYLSTVDMYWLLKH